MLVEMAIADAFAIPWEFVHKDDYGRVGSPHKGVYQRHPVYPDLGGGRYTDDTQRALANAECILGEEGQMYCDFVRWYLKAFHRDPRPGYSKQFYEFLQNTHTEEEWERKLIPSRDTNGALMGVVPLGYLKGRWQIRQAAYCQAMATHGPETFRYADTIAMAAHHFINGGQRSELQGFSRQYLPWDDYNLVYGKNPLPDDMTARSTCIQVMHALEKQHSLMGIIHYAIEHTSDSDSVAAVGVAIASCSSEYENDIPQSLYDGLEDGPYGRQYLAGIDRQLKEMHARK